MNQEYKVVAEAVRVEVNSESGDLYVVFLVSDEALKKSIKKDWVQDIEFRLLNKSLVGME